MHELAEQMLDLNRPLDPDAGSCSAAEVVAQVAALLSIPSQSSRWPIEVNAPAHADVAIAPDALKQVLVNVLRNAREAMPEGGRTNIDIHARHDEVVIEIADEGPGIPDSVLHRIFDPFFTTKGSGRGVGLGLFVAEGLTRRHGGRMWVQNRPEGGACFTIELPRTAALAPATSEPASIEAPGREGRP